MSALSGSKRSMPGTVNTRKTGSRSSYQPCGETAAGACEQFRLQGQFQLLFEYGLLNIPRAVIVVEIESHFPGGHKYVSFADMLERRPEHVIELAVKRMLPKNKLGVKMLKKLKVYRGPEHDNQAQKPEKLELLK